MKFFSRVNAKLPGWFDCRKAISTALALTLFCGLVAPYGYEEAKARAIHGGVASAASGTLLTTLTIQNTSGSTQAANFVTQVFGHPFKKGDIANGCTGGAPKFETTGGTNIPFSEGQAPVCWSDGSLKWAPFMLMVPSSISGSGSLTVNIKSGGTFPSASSRALSDASSGSTDLNVTVTGLDNLSGVWVSNLNQGISAALSDNYTYMDGDAGKVVRVRAPYRQSSADHGQLEGYWFLQLLNTNTGTFAGMRYLHRMTQPWYTVTSPAKNWRSFSAFAMNNGASLIRDMMASRYGAGKTFTATGGNLDLNSTAHGWDSGQMLKLTNSGGSLPTGFSTGTAYFMNASGANTFYLSTVSNVWDGGSNVVPSTGCTGTCTATSYPFLPMYTSIYTAGSNAKYDYIQAGGANAADSTTRIAFNNIYWRSTKMIGPYRFETITPTTVTTPTNYYIGTQGPLEKRRLADTGERYDIGPFNMWSVAHMYSQDANNEQNVRVVGLIGGFFPITLKSKSTFTIPVANNGHANNGTTYSGMPAVNTTMTIFNNGVGNPTDPNVNSAIGFTGADYSHLPEFNYYALLLTGEPQFNDAETEWGSAQLLQHLGLVEPGTAVVNGSTNSMVGIGSNGGAQRNITISGTTYRGASSGSPNGLRITAWLNRDAGYSAAIAGGYEPAGTVTRQYLNDVNTSIYAAYAAYIAILPAYAQAAGLYGEADLVSRNSAWQTAYLHGVTSLVAGMTEDSGALSFSTYLARWDKWVHDNFSTWMIPFYYGVVRTGEINTPAGNRSSNPYLTSTDGFCGMNDQIQASWTTSSTTFNLSHTSGGYVPATGDQIVFATTDLGLLDPPPTNFTQYVTYFMKNVSGNNFELATSVGGTAIAAGNTMSGQKICIGARSQANNSNIYGGGGGSGALQENIGSMYAAQAVGATVDATTLADMATNLGTVGGQSSGDGLKWTFGSTY
jgi:hypothetical protein